MKSILNRATLALAAALLVMATTAFTLPTTKTITVSNKCSFSIDQIFISDVVETNWGNDILDPDEVLEPGESVKIELECGAWDVKLVAPDGSTCEIRNIDLCGADIWEVNPDCAKE